MKLQLSTTWSSAHFYHQPKWSIEKNTEHFGKCYSQFGHGHDYLLEVEFSLNDEAAQTPLKDALDLLNAKLDHHHLNFIIPEFRDQIPTTENLALYCRHFLESEIKTRQIDCQIVVARLYEKPDLWVESYLT